MVEYGPYEGETACLAGEPTDDFHASSGLTEAAFDEVGVPDPFPVLDGEPQMFEQLTGLRPSPTSRCCGVRGAGVGLRPSALLLRGCKPSRVVPLEAVGGC